MTRFSKLRPKQYFCSMDKKTKYKDTCIKTTTSKTVYYTDCMTMKCAQASLKSLTAAFGSFKHEIINL